MRVMTWAAVLLCGLTLASPVASQDDAIPKELPPAPSTPPAEPTEAGETPPPPETPTPKKKLEFGDPPLHRWGGATVAVAAWEPDLVGADEEISANYVGNTKNPLMQGSTPHIRESVLAAYHLPKDLGSIVITYDSMSQSDSGQYLSPGDFIYAETRGYPFGLGAFDDGFADGVVSNLIRKTRDFRLYYSQVAFQNTKAKGTWSAGYYQLSHSRNVNISYLAIVPNLPPLIPPAVGANVNPELLNPRPDQVIQTANFSGHGLGARFDLEFPIQERVSIITGLSVGLIRGTSSSQYLSQTWVYTYPDPDLGRVILSSEQLFAILSSGSQDDILRVNQEFVNVGLNQAPESAFAQSLDVYFGLEVKIWKGLKVYGTVRDVFYANVGEYKVPKPDGGEQTTELSAGYEGYVIGLSWRF